MEPFIQAVFLAAANKAIVSYVTAPIKQKYPDIDYWFLIYVALATGAAIGYIANINLFADFIPDVLTGRILTAILIGGGSGLIYDVFDKKPSVQIMVVESGSNGGNGNGDGDSQTNLMTAGDSAVTVNQPGEVK